MRVPRRPRIPFLTALIVLAAATAGAVLWHDTFTPHTAHAHQAPGPVVVEVAPAIAQTVMPWKDFSGRLEATEYVEIRPLVAGTLTKVHFEDGSMVNKGAPLFTIDPRPYITEVERTTANHRAARAKVLLTTAELKRANRLFTENAIAKRDIESKQHDVSQAQAELQAAQAALDAAQLALSYTNIVAPISGRLSRAEQTEGNIIGEGAASTPLTTLVSVDHMYATFDIDENTYLQRISPARLNQASIPVRLALTHEDNYPREGVIHSIDNRIDIASGTIRVRARFDNTDGALIPGMYARIRLGSLEEQATVLVQEHAIGIDQDKRYVVVVDDLGKTTYRHVTLGSRHGTLRMITHGLHAGELVVINGLQHVQPGDVITPHQVSMNPAISAVAAGPTAR